MNKYQKGFAPIVIAIIVLILVGVGGTSYYLINKQLAKQTACTMDAKICPDGTAVGRAGPNCEFATCPEMNRVGGDKDDHGCIASAGYSWCELKNKCLRTWEEPCSDKVITDENGGIVVKESNYPEDSKGLFLKLHIENDKITLLSKPEFTTAGYPNYLPGSYKFIARIISSNDIILGEYGFSDPRIIQAEQGYQGPTWLDSTDFILIIPYFKDAQKINIYSSTGLMLSINVSDLITK